MSDRETIHATTVAIEGRGVMILGDSSSGKSDLALRLIDRGAQLVADDYTEIRRDNDNLLADAPLTIRGRIEVRGLGIVALPHVDGVPITLAVRLCRDVERMPERATKAFAGVAIRVLTLDPRPASAPLIVEYALRYDLP
nr:HPr kinase/phosphatase C-terminal domain-containing protein [Sphingomonas jeddahensis]